MKKEPLLFHIMLRQAITGFTLASSTQETVQDNIDTFPGGLCSNATVQFPVQVLPMPAAGGHH